GCPSQRRDSSEPFATARLYTPRESFQSLGRFSLLAPPREPIERAPWYISDLNCLRSCNLSDALNEISDQATLISRRKMVLDELASPGLGLAGHFLTDFLPRHPDFLIGKKPRVFLNLGGQRLRVAEELDLLPFAFSPQRRCDRLNFLFHPRQPSLVVLNYRLSLLFSQSSRPDRREDFVMPRSEKVT